MVQKTYWVSVRFAIVLCLTIILWYCILFLNVFCIKISSSDVPSNSWFLSSFFFLYHTFLYASNFFPRYLTDAQPHPDFFSGFMNLLHAIAQALGDAKTISVSWLRILPSSSKSPTNFWPCLKCQIYYFLFINSAWCVFVYVQ